MSTNTFKTYLIEKRFNFLFFSLLFLVFHPLLFTTNFTKNYGLPLSMVLVFCSSYLLFLEADRLKKIVLIIFYAFLFAVFMFFTFVVTFQDIYGSLLGIVINLLFMSYFVLIFYQLMKEIFKDDEFDVDMILGAVSGFILLNMISSFLFIMTDYLHPNSFKGVDTYTTENIFDEYLYHSFVTLTSIGYGDIVPTTLWAKKMVMLTGTLGQFYIIVVVSLVVSKYASKMKK